MRKDIQCRAYEKTLEKELITETSSKSVETREHQVQSPCHRGQLACCRNGHGLQLAAEHGKVGCWCWQPRLGGSGAGVLLELKRSGLD